MRKIFIYLIKFYQMVISPLFPSVCRFSPSCSEYAVQAFTKYGAFKGSIKTVWRILRCNPFSKGGYDPVE